MAYALAKALMKINPEYKKIFACFALDKHDPRRKEPKRIGLYSARVRPPYVRRWLNIYFHNLIFRVYQFIWLLRKFIKYTCL